LTSFLIFTHYSHHRWLNRSASLFDRRCRYRRSQSDDRWRFKNGTIDMAYYYITILILTISLTLHEKRHPVYGRALCFDRFGGRITRVFPHLEWNPHSGRTFPLRFETQQTHHPILLLKWKRILHEKRNYHQFYCERTPYCHS
jgi:hypothetical protein